MNYEFLFERKRDIEGYKIALDSVIENIGEEAFAKLSYKSKMKYLDMQYLAKIIVRIALDRLKTERKPISLAQDKALPAEPHTASPDEKD